jgi:hypothetical protein
MNKLFSVHSLVRDFTYQGTQYEEIKVVWFVVERKAPPVPFETAIEDYAQLDEKARLFPEGYINEQFSRQEAEALKKHLDRRPGVTTMIETVELPVMANVSGCRRLERGNGNDFLILHREKSYSLPFKVEGYFSVRFAEPKILGDERSTVVVRRPVVDEKK